MRIINAALEALASNYTRGMTSIRGRRIHRLVMREFSSFDFVVLARTGSGKGALLGLSEGRAALCATDGKGKEVTVTTWTFPALSVSETRFDLLKDSLPTLGTRPCPTPLHQSAPESQFLMTLCLRRLAQWRQRLCRRLNEVISHSTRRHGGASVANSHGVWGHEMMGPA
jgi:hypothetical protein